jgi:hypothetical protein
MKFLDQNGAALDSSIFTQGGSGEDITLTVYLNGLLPSSCATTAMPH